MKKRFGYSVLLATMVLVTLGFGFSPAPKAAAAASANQPDHLRGNGNYVPGQLIVGLVPSASQGPLGAQAQGLAQTMGAKVLKTGQGMALLGMDENTNLRMMETQVAKMKGVRYVEPNYIYKGSDQEAPPTVTPPTDYIIREMQGRNSPDVIKAAYPVAGLQAMKSKVNGVLAATYPNDPFLWWNAGWKYVGADIVSSNTTSSKSVCLLDTGVDYKHPDLAANVVKGYDFVNADSDPMDDYGTGTHAAGIIAASRNNGQGIAGVSTGKLVAVKVMDANDVGTAYDISLGIQYCANRSDVNILDLSMAGPNSVSVQTAVGIAVNKGKLVVAAAGDSGGSDPAYPAALSTMYPSGVVAVAASGLVSGPNVDYSCRGGYSNNGAWITLVAPGTSIYSTLPYDKPFGLHEWMGYKERYDYTDGTGNAAAFVAAAAARAWGYKPSLTNALVRQRLIDSGFSINTLVSICWPASMAGAKEVNVASALDRGAATFTVKDAVTDLPIVAATVSVYFESTLWGSSTITASSPIDPQTNLVNMVFNSWADVINLPAQYNGSTLFTPKVSATNYTASAQSAFVVSRNWSNYTGDAVWVYGGKFSQGGSAYVPPKMSNFIVTAVSADGRPHLALWLPGAYQYIVSSNDSLSIYGDVDTRPYGSLNEAPFARWMNYDAQYESIVIHNRTSDTAAPWFPGTYQVGITDGATSGTNLLDNDNVSALVWKDGVIKYRVDKGGTSCQTSHWSWPLQIISPASGAATYHTLNTCTALAGAPYSPP